MIEGQELFANDHPILVVDLQEAAGTASSGDSSLGVGRCLCTLPTAVCRSFQRLPPNVARRAISSAGAGYQAYVDVLLSSRVTTRRAIVAAVLVKRRDLEVLLG